jgi:hypothetical protein
MLRSVGLSSRQSVTLYPCQSITLHPVPQLNTRCASYCHRPNFSPSTYLSFAYEKRVSFSIKPRDHFLLFGQTACRHYRYNIKNEETFNCIIGTKIYLLYWRTVQIVVCVCVCVYVCMYVCMYVGMGVCGVYTCVCVCVCNFVIFVKVTKNFVCCAVKLARNFS